MDGMLVYRTVIRGIFLPELRICFCTYIEEKSSVSKETDYKANMIDDSVNTMVSFAF